MKLVSIFTAAALATALSAASYVVDVSHSSVGFEVKHMSVSNTKGYFKKFSGEVDYDGKKLTKMNGEITIADINTNDSTRDEHLQQPDYFDAAKYPKGTFKLLKHEGSKVTAEITLRGIKKNVEFDVEVSGPVLNPMSKKNIIAVSLKTEINRKDFNIAAKYADSIIGEKVKVNIEIEAVAK